MTANAKGSATSAIIKSRLPRAFRTQMNGLCIAQTVFRNPGRSGIVGGIPGKKLTMRKNISKTMPSRKYLTPKRGARDGSVFAIGLDCLTPVIHTGFDGKGNEMLQKNWVQAFRPSAAS